MRKLLGKIKSISYYHYIAVGITVGFLALTFFVFPTAITRIGEAFRDLFYSIGFYGAELFEIDHNIQPTVNSYSSLPLTPFFFIPETWEEFLTNFDNFWRTFLDSENFALFMSGVAEFLYNALSIILLIGLPIALICYLGFRKYFQTENNDYNVDSRQLTWLKNFSAKYYLPCKKWMRSLVTFLKESNYLKIWLVIWLFNFNVITIVIEFISYYFYFVPTFDVVSLYKQVYKLLCDLSVPVNFIPGIVWALAGYVLFCWLRRRIGYKVLEHHEMKNRGLINKLGICVLGCGSMGAHKTTVLTDMAESLEVMFLDKALELMNDVALRFPYFPWITLENEIKTAVEKHEIYSLVTCRIYVAKLKAENYDFEYDVDRYGNTFCDSLKTITLWESIETYAQLYFLYTLKTSFLVFNYSVRTDNVFEDTGNFPLWNTEFFRRSVKESEEASKYAHILNFDALRLGKKVKNNPDSNYFEFGVVGITEVGKERGNMTEHKYLKKDEGTNQLNDLFDLWLKMIRHSATVEYYPFARVFMDEQRPENLGANARELANILGLRDTSERKMAYPMFFLIESLYGFIARKYENMYLTYRHNRSDNTVFSHLLKTVMHKCYKHYKFLTNTFGYKTVEIDMQRGSSDDVETHKYYLSSKKIYSNRFSTDCFSDFFSVKALKSSIGLDDVPTYEGIKATFSELAQQNSYFITDLLKGLK